MTLKTSYDLKSNFTSRMGNYPVSHIYQNPYKITQKPRYTTQHTSRSRKGVACVGTDCLASSGTDASDWLEVITARSASVAGFDGSRGPHRDVSGFDGSEGSHGEPDSRVTLELQKC